MLAVFAPASLVIAGTNECGRDAKFCVSTPGSLAMTGFGALAVRAAGNRTVDRIIALSKGKLDRVSADIALNNYDYEDLERFFTELHNFEEHFTALVDRQISLLSVEFRFEPSSEDTISIAPNLGILRINAAKHRDLLVELNYDLAHEYSHFLFSARDFVEDSLPEDLKSEERGPTWWLNERAVTDLVLRALIHKEGLSHPFFGVIKIEGDLSEEGLPTEVIELLANRVGSIITDKKAAYYTQELAVIEAVYEDCKGCSENDLGYFAIMLANYYVWAKMRNHEELAAQFKELIRHFSGNKREAFDTLSEDLIALWMSFDEQARPGEPATDDDAQRAP